jgi:ABC-type transport system involved in multi-copper enzyme maturation permease subunit
MLHLLRIDLKKLTGYRTFWVVCGLYFLTLAFVTASGMEFLKWLASKGAEFGTTIKINRIPLYHFPDVWQNLVFVSGLFKLVLAVMVVISITNEYTYRTVRQNVIDGLSRWEFLQSKMLTNLLLSLMSVAMVFSIALITGLIYTPVFRVEDVWTDLEFFPAYFLEIFAFLSYALMLGVLVQRSGLTIILLMLSHMIEAIIKVNLPYSVEAAKVIFPMESITNLVPMPFARYAFQEIQDYVKISSVAIALIWTVIFNGIAYWRLKVSDI